MKKKSSLVAPSRNVSNVVGVVVMETPWLNALGFGDSHMAPTVAICFFHNPQQTMPPGSHASV